MGRALALDYGDKRIGVAMSDESRTIAQLRPFISEDNKQELLEIIQKENVDTILIGLPLNMKGEETASVKKVREFGEWIEKQTGFSVEYIDERLSTVQARQKLEESQISGHKAREYIDSMSAQILLEAYLEINR